MKLYPPSIEGKLPACAGQSLIIPFTMNRSVGMSQIGGMALIIKTVQTGRTLGTLLNGSHGFDETTGMNSAIFDITKLGLVDGQYYKVQIAYIEKFSNEVGYYSSIGVLKKTTEPDLTVPNLENNFYSSHEYTGKYSQEGRDETEKVYSYCFELKDMDGNLIDTSGTLVHDSSADDPQRSFESQDTWKSTVALVKDIPYYLTYKLTTMNNLNFSSQRYIVMDQDSIDIDLPIELESQLNYEDGSVKLYIQPSGESDAIISGSFVLVRGSSLNNFGSWDEVYRFSYMNVTLSKDKPTLLWEDCTVQQGENYTYALQAYNSKGLYSNRLEAKNGSILVDFEDAFLYDGKRQLKIRFNPKISNFKNVVLESKMDTIGSKYPFIFKNGYVHYKEIGISGLISVLSDPNEKFMSHKEWESMRTHRISTPGYGDPQSLSSDLTSANIYNERQFKLEVMDWLNNGKPKIFRSPTEGNYIVRIMNVSLTPNDTLGRMLHSFQCTAYEVADWDFNNLVKLDLIELPLNKKATIKIGQIQPQALVNLYYSNNTKFKEKYQLFQCNSRNEIVFSSASYRVNITEAIPGTIVGMQFTNGKGIEQIEIGNTGAYYVQANEYALSKLILDANSSWGDMKVTFEYYDDTPNDSFSSIASLQLTDEIRRFVGPGYTTNLVEPVNLSKVAEMKNYIISDIRREIGNFHYIKVEKRYIQEMWPTKDGAYSRNEILNDIILDNEWNPVIIYHDVIADKYYSGGLSSPILGTPDYRFCLNDEDENYIDLGGRLANEADSVRFGDTFGRIEAIRNVGNVTKLQVGNGLLLDVAYRVRTKEYLVESEAEVEAKKNNWIAAQDYLNYLIQTSDSAAIEAYVDTVNEAYKLFIMELEAALKRKAG